MRKIEELTLEECRAALADIQEALYGDTDDDGNPILNPDVEWSSDQVVDVANALDRIGLVPDAEENPGMGKSLPKCIGDKCRMGPCEYFIPGDNSCSFEGDIPLKDQDKRQEIIDFVIAEWDAEHMGPMPDNDDEAVRSFAEYFAEQDIPVPW
jgi:hypothetical protein